MNKTFVARIVVVLILLGAGGGLGLWKYRAMHRAAPPMPEPAQAVQVVPARTTPWQPTAELSGTVLAIQSVTLGSEVSGTVKEVLFESGSVVDAGQVLVRLDTSTEEADLRAAEATVSVNDAAIKVAEADQRLAESNLRRLTQAVEARAVSEAELDTARSTLDSASSRLQRARAERDQAQAKVDQMKATIAKKTLRAPFKAMAGLRNIHPGQYLAEGAPVVGLQSITDDIYLDFAIPQEHIAEARPGLVVMARAPMLGDQPLRIQVAAVDAVADPVTRNIRVRAVVPNTDHRLRPGMFVDVTVPVGETREYVTIPSTAVRRASFGDHVFVVSKDEQDPGKSRAHQRFIKLGPMIGQDVIVTDGLKPGEQVAANGSFKLQDKGLVMPGGGAPPGEAAPAGAGAGPGPDDKAGGTSARAQSTNN